jgi:amidohydrolase
MPTTLGGQKLDATIDTLLPELIEFRHDLHRHPELCYEEHRTSERVRTELARIPGVEIKGGMAGGTGVLAHLPATVHTDRPAVALRADMDALPLTEISGKPYASTKPGLMHACGHDGHTTILLGTARLLASLEHRPNPVTFVFQPAEEGGAGGERMCNDGALNGVNGGGLGPRVGRIFGLHGWPEMTLGTFGSRVGPLLAATDDFVVRIKGVGGHAAMPHMVRDPIVAAAAVVTQLQTIASRCTSPLDSVVCTVGTIHGGVADNIVPNEIEMTGTVRTLRATTRVAAREQFFRITEHTAQAHGCTAEIQWLPGYPVTSNDAETTERFFHVARQVFGPEHVSEIPEPFMGGEDFSYYGLHVPACFFLLGLLPVGDDPRTTPRLHQPTFDFNDEAIGPGVRVMASMALSE